MSPGGRVRAHFRQNVVGYVALFCFAIGGTALALPGRNSVDSGDIKRGQVKAADLGAGAVTGAKLKSNAVTPGKVADRQRSFVIAPAELARITSTATNPEIYSNGGYQRAEFAGALDEQLTAMTQVPTDRAAGSPLEIRLFWSVNSIGDVVWHVGAKTVVPGASETVNVPFGDEVVATSAVATNFVRTLVATVPAEEITNGAPLALLITRDGPDPADTAINPAYIHAIEISYRATG